MKKASRILIIVSALLSIVASIIFIVYVFIFFSEATYITSGQGIATQDIDKVNASALETAGIVFLLLLFINAGNAVICFLSLRFNLKVFYILDIVMGVISGLIVPGIIGGIFGILTIDEPLEVEDE